MSSEVKRENSFYVDSDKLSKEALEKKHRLENDPSVRTDPFEYMDGMEKISSDIMDKVIAAMNDYDYNKYTAVDVKRALDLKHCCHPQHFHFLKIWQLKLK